MLRLPMYEEVRWNRSLFIWSNAPTKNLARRRLSKGPFLKILDPRRHLLDSHRLSRNQKIVIKVARRRNIRAEAQFFNGVASDRTNERAHRSWSTVSYRTLNDLSSLVSSLSATTDGRDPLSPALGQRAPFGRPVRLSLSEATLTVYFLT